MKTKLTLSIEKESVDRIKWLAARRKTSVSRLFEMWSRDMTADRDPGHQPGQGSGLRGLWSTARTTDTDPRLDYLLKKHAGQ